MNVLNRVAIVGASTLKGKELKDLLEERNFPAHEIKLLDADELLGQLETYGDEMTFVQSVTPEQLAGVDLAFFASDEVFTRTTWQHAREAGAAIVDLSFALEDEVGVVIRSPWIERQLGEPQRLELDDHNVVAAHPLSIALALLLLRANATGRVKHAAVTAFEPASEHGRRGMDELHQQTINLLSFQKLPTEVFDSQVAFNLISQYGSASQPALDTIERRVLRHFQAITKGRAPVPSLMLMQAPVFHGHTFSIYIELENSVSVGDFAASLAGEHVNITSLAEDAPSNVNAAGQEDVLISIRRDAQRENGMWIWGAADNLKIAAVTAAECASVLAASRPQGKVQ